MTFAGDLGTNLFADAVWFLGASLIARVRQGPSWGAELQRELAARGSDLSDSEAARLVHWIEGSSVEDIGSLTSDSTAASLEAAVFNLHKLEASPTDRNPSHVANEIRSRASKLAQSLVPALVACHTAEARAIVNEIESIEVKRSIGDVLTRLLDEDSADHAEPRFALRHVRLRPPQRHPLSAQALLWAGYGVVPFQPPGNLIEHLTAWRDADAPIDVCYLSGDSGVGKTRCALEFCRSSAWEGWYSGVLEQFSSESLAALSFDRTNRLIVVDYAETRPDLVRDLLVSLVASRPLRSWRIRVLLVCRSPTVQAEPSRYFVSGQSDADNLLLTGTHFPAHKYAQRAFGQLDDRESYYRSAVRAFEAMLGVSASEVVPPDLSADLYGLPLTISMRALLSIDWEQRRYTTRESLVDALLDREERRFWSDSPLVSSTSTRTALAVLGIRFPRDRRRASELLSACPELRTDEATRFATVDWAREVYGDEGACWACGPRPDILSERLAEQSIDSDLLDTLCSQDDAVEAIATTFARTAASNWGNGIRQKLVELVLRQAIRLARAQSADRTRAGVLADLIPQLRLGDEAIPILAAARPSSWTPTGRFFLAVSVAVSDHLTNTQAAGTDRSAAFLDASIRARHLGLEASIELGEMALMALPDTAPDDARAVVLNQLANSLHRFGGVESIARVEQLLREATAIDCRIADEAESAEANLAAAQSMGDLGSFLLESKPEEAIVLLERASNLLQAMLAGDPGSRQLALEAERLRRNYVNGTIVMQRKFGEGFDPEVARQLLSEGSLFDSFTRRVNDAEMWLEIGEPIRALGLTSVLLADLDGETESELEIIWLQAHGVWLRARAAVGQVPAPDPMLWPTLRSIYQARSSYGASIIADSLIGLAIVSSGRPMISALHRLAAAMELVGADDIEACCQFLLAAIGVSIGEVAVGNVSSEQQARFWLASAALKWAQDGLLGRIDLNCAPPRLFLLHAAASTNHAVALGAMLRPVEALQAYEFAVHSYALYRVRGGLPDEGTEAFVRSVGSFLDSIDVRQSAH